MRASLTFDCQSVQSTIATGGIYGRVKALQAHAPPRKGNRDSATGSRDLKGFAFGRRSGGRRGATVSGYESTPTAQQTGRRPLRRAPCGLSARYRTRRWIVTNGQATIERIAASWVRWANSRARVDLRSPLVDL